MLGQSFAVFSNTSSPLVSVLKQLRTDTAFADVCLLVGASETPILAHACILAANSDYYKEALSAKWRRDAEEQEKTEDILDDSSSFKKSNTSSGKRIATQRITTLRHPETDTQVVEIVLEFLYSGQTRVCESQLVGVAQFADEILLRGFAMDCLSHFVSSALSARNALEVFVACDRMGCDGHKERALLLVKSDLDDCLALGSASLAGMSMNAFEAALLFRAFSHLDRWALLVARAKSLQGLPVAVNDTADNVRLDWDKAAADVSDFLPLVKLFSFTPQEYDASVAPYLSMLPESMHDYLQFHYHGALPERAVLEWGSETATFERSKILNHKQLHLLERELRVYIPLHANCTAGSQSTDGMVLVHRGSTSQFSAAEFHQECKGKRNTVSIIKTASGKIVGGFVDCAWTSNSGYLEATRAFLFQVSAINKTELKLDFLSCKNLNHAVGGRAGLAFGDDLYVSGTACYSYLGAIFGCYNANGLTAATFLGASNSPVQVEIAEYEVFEIK
ncbi:hypothetical protein HDU77_011407 [Chytriomyces hyalinus]|nr:hypothetical protein HDU77_011407 [Chytriomyces hyalinus]